MENSKLVNTAIKKANKKIEEIYFEISSGLGTGSMGMDTVRHKMEEANRIITEIEARQKRRDAFCRLE